MTNPGDSNPYQTPAPGTQYPQYGNQPAGYDQQYGSAPVGQNYAGQNYAGQNYAQQNYPNSAYPNTGYPQQSQSTNTLAIVALISSFFVSLAGVICGHIALSQIKKTGEQGRGMAIAGLVIGYLGIAAGIAYILFFVVLFGSAAVWDVSTY